MSSQGGKWWGGVGCRGHDFVALDINYISLVRLRCDLQHLVCSKLKLFEKKNNHVSAAQPKISSRCLLFWKITSWSLDPSNEQNIYCDKQHVMFCLSLFFAGILVIDQQGNLHCMSNFIAYIYWGAKRKWVAVETLCRISMCLHLQICSWTKAAAGRKVKVVCTEATSL